MALGAGCEPWPEKKRSDVCAMCQSDPVRPSKQKVCACCRGTDRYINRKDEARRQQATAESRRRERAARVAGTELDEGGFPLDPS